MDASKQRNVVEFVVLLSADADRTDILVLSSLLADSEGSPTGGSRRTSCACRKHVLDKPTHIHARNLTPTHIQGCQSTDLNKYSSLDQVPSNFMNVERSCDVAKYARLTEPGAVAGSGQVVVVVETRQHEVVRPKQGLP